jgi:hypothetical protein
MTRSSSQMDHSGLVSHIGARSIGRAFAETIAEITIMSERRAPGRPRGTTGIARTGEKARRKLAERHRRHLRASGHLEHLIEMREQLERSRHEKTRRHEVFLIGEALYEQMAVSPDLRTAIRKLLDDHYIHDRPRVALGLPKLTTEEKAARKRRQK